MSERVDRVCEAPQTSSATGPMSGTDAQWALGTSSSLLLPGSKGLKDSRLKVGQSEDPMDYAGREGGHAFSSTATAGRRNRRVQGDGVWSPSNPRPSFSQHGLQSWHGVLSKGREMHRCLKRLGHFSGLPT